MDSGAREVGLTQPPNPIMADVHEQQATKIDERTVTILAKNIYREVRAGGLTERDVMALAGELLALVTNDVKAEAEVSGG